MSQLPDTQTDISSGLDLRDLLDRLPGMAYRCRWDGDWAMEYVSRGCGRITGYTPEQLTSTVPWSELVHPEDLVTVIKQFRLVVEERRPFRLQYRLILANGKVRSIIESGRVASAEGEYPRYIEGFIVEEGALEARTHDPATFGDEHPNILDRTREAFLAVDRHGAIVEWNRRAAEIFGWPRNDAIGHIAGDLLVPKSLRDAFRRKFVEITRNPAQEIISASANVQAVRRNGELFPVEITIWPGRSDNNLILNAFVNDLTELRALEQRIKDTEGQLDRLRREDPVTCLASRLTLEQELIRAVAFAERWRQPLSFIVVGPEDLPAGERHEPADWDVLVRTVASGLKACCRTEDLPARLDVERFAVLLPNTRLENAMVVARRIESRCEEPAHGQPEFAVSVGVSALAPGESPNALIARTIQRMEEAREIQGPLSDENAAGPYPGEIGERNDSNLRSS